MLQIFLSAKICVLDQRDLREMYFAASHPQSYYLVPMTNAWLVVAGILLLVATGLLIASYSKLRTRNFLIRLQSREIERQIRELVGQNSQAQDLVREKKQLILLVSHDLKGPFNRMYAFMQLP